MEETDTLSFVQRIAAHYEEGTISDDLEAFLATVPSIPATDDLGHDHTLHDFYQQFVKLIDGNLEIFQTAEKISEQEFVAKCQSEQNSCDEDSPVHRILNSILAGSSFEAFIALVRAFQQEQDVDNNTDDEEET